MNHWINTISRDHVRIGVAGGFTQANHGRPHSLKKLQRDDLIVFYSPKTQLRDGKALQCFTAIGQVIDDEPFQVEMSESFKPFRRKLSFFDCKETPIRPLLDQLKFIKNKDKWGYPFRAGLFPIEAEDFRLIAAAMNVSVLKEALQPLT